MEDNRFDGLFMNAVQQSHGIDQFFDNLFGFFRRKTDFFQQEEFATKKVNDSLKKHLDMFKADKVRQEAIEKKKAAE